MTDKKTIFEIQQCERNPGYKVFGEVLKNLDSSKTLQLSSVMLGAKHPDPHKLFSVTLLPEAFTQLIRLLEPHAKP